MSKRSLIQRVWALCIIALFNTLVFAAKSHKPHRSHHGRAAQNQKAKTVSAWMEFRSPDYGVQARFRTLGHPVRVILSRDGMGHSFQYWSKSRQRFYTVFTISRMPYAASAEDEA